MPSDDLKRMVDIVRASKFGADCDSPDCDSALLNYMQQSYEEDGNPFAIWVAVDWCKKKNLNISPWMVDVLASMGTRIFEVLNREDATREAERVGKALGFGMAGKGQQSKAAQLIRGRRDDEIAFHIFAEMWMAAERGAPIGPAKAAASVAKEYRVSSSTAERVWEERGEAAKSWLRNIAKKNDIPDPFGS